MREKFRMLPTYMQPKGDICVVKYDSIDKLGLR